MATNSLSVPLLESVITLLSHLKYILLDIEFWINSFSVFFSSKLKTLFSCKDIVSWTTCFLKISLWLFKFLLMYIQCVQGIDIFEVLFFPEGYRYYL